jgi:hypothetical protein
MDLMSLLSASPETLDLLAMQAASQMAPPPGLGAPGGVAANPFAAAPMPDYMGLAPPAVQLPGDPASTNAWEKMMNPPTTPPFMPEGGATAVEGVRKPAPGITAEQARALAAMNPPVEPLKPLPAAAIQKTGPVSMQQLVLPTSPASARRGSFSSFLGGR